MKIVITRKLPFSIILFFMCAGTSFALNHGSMKGAGVAMYDQGSLGGNTAGTAKTATLDYKLVTIGNKTWAWNKVNGATIDTGADWCSQLRYWSGTGTKTENNMLSRNATANLATEVWTSSTAFMPSPLKISFFQNLTSGIGMAETAAFAYNPTAINSAVAGDNTSPVITTASATTGETTATLNITGSDDQSDVFYHIVGTGIEEIAFTSNFELAGLTPNTEYSLSVTPIDFSGNEGTTQTVTFTTAGLTQITSGIAKDIKFVLLSTNDKLEYYYEFTNQQNTFRDAFLQITPAGGTMFEVKPSISPDGKYAYGATSDPRIAGKVLSLDLGYFIYAEGDPIWDDYVVENRVITEGALKGTSIKHQMNGGIAPSEKETVAPILDKVTLSDVTNDYIKLHILGADNSGTVYYQITGATNTADAFRTGDFYLTSIEPGRIYDLTVVAKDLSGNVSRSVVLKAKTANQRSNISNNNGMGYNTTTPPANGGELVSILNFDGTNLTLGCTTASTVIQNAEWKNRELYNPTVKINGTSYPLTLDTNKTTASITFNGKIGQDETAILLSEGTVLNIQWSVFWGETGGNFFTGTYIYKLGDEGQSDTEGPSLPELSATGTTLTWPTCTDLLSGVKCYRIEESGVSTIIMDLGEPSFSYEMAASPGVVTVTAVDFAGNTTSASIGNTTGVDETKESDFSLVTDLHSGHVSIKGVNAKKAAIYDLTAKVVAATQNTNRIDVSNLIAGIYLVKVVDSNGKNHSAKLVVR